MFDNSETPYSFRPQSSVVFCESFTKMEKPEWWYQRGK